ncbi:MULTISPECIES: hypothetical protein [unclassified Streptomyces]|uniref:hypothetical protein n=1 Tax=unclassified Streptomyces TaxID=2593676 RepID=UPI0035D76EE3
MTVAQRLLPMTVTLGSGPTDPGTIDEFALFYAHRVPAAAGSGWDASACSTCSPKTSTHATPSRGAATASHV